MDCVIRMSLKHSSKISYVQSETKGSIRSVLSAKKQPEDGF
jgi:hypothetical protein